MELAVFQMQMVEVLTDEYNVTLRLETLQILLLDRLDKEIINVDRLPERQRQMMEIDLSKLRRGHD